MTSSESSKQNETAAAEQLFQMALGFIPAISVNVAAKLSIAERLAAGPKTVEELAPLCKADSESLYRLMRALASVGVFREVDHKRFEQTALSDLLRADHPRSMKPFVVFFPDPLHFRCYANLMHSVQTGQTSVKPTFGKELFEYLAEHPDDSAIFNAAMVNLTHMFIPAILEAYDFKGIRVLADIGGGHGSVVGSILQKYPEMKGILFDMEHVVRGAGSYLQSLSVADRCTVTSGDFFKSVPAGADTYIMKNIIHDWDDEKSIAIMRNIRQALGDRKDGKLLLLEFVVTPGNEPHLAKWADIEMLALPGGKERTEAEYAELFSKCGFRLNRLVPTQAPQSVIEAVAV
jgi:hypothetical protein